MMKKILLLIAAVVPTFSFAGPAPTSIAAGRDAAGMSYRLGDFVELGARAGFSFSKGAGNSQYIFTGSVGASFLTPASDNFDVFWFGVYPGGGCSKTNISGGDKQTDRYFLVNLPLLNLGLQYQNVGIVIGPWLTFSRISKTTFANFNLFSAEFRYYF